MSIAARSIHGFNVCIIPNADNGFHPLALRKKPLAIVSTLLIATKLAALVILGITPATAQLSTITASRIVELTNSERVAENLPALTTNTILAQAAQAKANDILENDYFAHISPSGVTPWFWMTQAGYSYQVAGENLAIDFTEAEDVVAAWMASPTHKANILLDDYTETGVAVASGEFQGGTSIVVVHMFGKPSGAAAPVSVQKPTPTPEPAVEASTATPTPTPVITPVPDTTPPRSPRIAYQDNVVSDTITVTIDAEPLSTANILLNNQLRTTQAVDDSGTATAVVSLANISDGDHILRAYAVDAAGNESELSPPVVLTKDTTAPALNEEAITYVLNPAFDTEGVAVLLDTEIQDTVAVRQGGNELPLNSSRSIAYVSTASPVTVALTDNAGNKTSIEDTLAPAFDTLVAQDALAAPASVWQFSRRVTTVVLGALVVLLALAVTIRVRIQHPRLITHASLVIILAAVLLFV